MVDAGGLEPSTPALSRRCSNQLSYASGKGVTPGSAGEGRDQAPILFYAILARGESPRRGAFGARD